MNALKDLYYLVYPGLYLSTKASFYTLFLELYRSGITVGRCCELLARRIKDSRLRATLELMATDLANDKGFEESLRRHAAVLGNWDIALMLAGERAGKLEEFLTLLKNHYERRLEHHRLIIGSATPAVFTLLLFLFFFSLVDFLTGGIVAYVMATIVPLAILVPLAAVAWALLKRAGGLAPIQAIWEPISLALPLVGSLKRELITARFADSFALLLSSGLEAEESLRLASQSTGLAALEHKTRALLGQGSLGKGWSTALTGLPGLKPEFVDALALAEETGRLDRVSQDIARESQAKATKKLETVLPIATKLVVIPILVIFFFSKLWFAGIALVKLLIVRFQEILQSRVHH